MPSQMVGKKRKIFKKQATRPKSPFVNLVDEFSIKYKIQFLLSEKLEKEFQVHLEPVDIQVEHPADKRFGDYATNVCMVLSSRLGKGPGEIAEVLRESILTAGGVDEVVSSVETAGPGFLNFRLSRKWLLEHVQEVVIRGDDYGKTELGKGRKEMVEFNQANTNKHFHVGHLRNTSLGESLCRLLECNGFKVWRTSYQGDIGVHVAKTIWAILYSNAVERVGQLDGEEFMDFISEIYVKGANAYKEDERVKEEIDELNRRIYEEKEAGSGELYEIWRELRSKALKYFDVIYDQLGTFFDKLYFDSDVIAGKEDVVEGLKQGVFEESDGAIIFPGEKYGLHTRVFINQKGVPTYDAKDIRLAKMKAKDFDFEHCIFVIGEEQKEYLQVIFKALELLNLVKEGAYFHRYYGFVNLGHEGKVVKMSSRLGNVVTLVDLLKEAKSRIKEYLKSSGKKYSAEDIESISEKVAVGALKYSMLKIEPEKSIAFDLEKSISFEGDSAPYLQYTYARGNSILQRAEKVDLVKLAAKKIETDALLCPLEKVLLGMIYQFPEVVNEATRNLEPHRICPYLFDLAQSFNSFYQKIPVLKAESEDLRNLRLLVTAAVVQIIKNGLTLLGIEVLEEM